MYIVKRKEKERDFPYERPFLLREVPREEGMEEVEASPKEVVRASMGVGSGKGTERIRLRGGERAASRDILPSPGETSIRAEARPHSP